MPPKRPFRRRQTLASGTVSKTAPAGEIAAEGATDCVGRSLALDSVRGLAILLMVVDHISGILLNIPITPDTIRFGTRLSLPLFAVLVGYFFAKMSHRRQSLNGLATADLQQRLVRLGQILGAATIVNLLTYPLLGKLEILASFAVAYLFYFLLGRHFTWLVVALPLYSYDPSLDYFDYPVLLVASLVACGSLLAARGFSTALIVSLLMVAIGTPLVPPPSVYVVWFLPPAIAIVSAASQWREVQHPWLSNLGQFPLTAYVCQYAVIMLIWLVAKR